MLGHTSPVRYFCSGPDVKEDRKPDPPFRPPLAVKIFHPPSLSKGIPSLFPKETFHQGESHPDVQQVEFRRDSSPLRGLLTNTQLSPAFFTDRATPAFALMNTIALFWPILQLLSSAIVLLRLLLPSAIVPIPPSLPRRHCVETPSTQHRPLRPRPPDSGTRINRIHTPAPSFLEEPPTANRRESTNKPRPLRSQDTDRKIRHPHTPTAHL